MTTFSELFFSIVPAFVSGLVLRFGLIVAIGAQNAFVLRQGLWREHVGAQFWPEKYWHIGCLLAVIRE